MRASTQLPRYLSLAYGLLVAYACLHPFSGWRVQGLPLFDFLLAPWPRYYRIEDIILNVLGFIPLGFVLTAAWPAHWPRPRAVALSVLLCAALSLSLETLQTLLPTRVASNVDLGANIIGGALGALLGAALGRRIFDTRGWLHQWHEKRILDGHLGDVGVVLLALWLLAQLSPDSLLFAVGDLRRLFDLPAPLPFSPERFMRLEAAVVAAHLVAAGLVARACLQRFSLTIVVLIALGLAARTLAATSFYMPPRPLLWLTPGAIAGLGAGLPVLAAALALPAALRQTLAAIALLAGTVLVNVTPENPYLSFNQALINQGHFLNFNGLTQLVASLWPFLALTYLSAVNLRRGGGR
ncbi:VanZ family protein [Denitromonas iodatirespirans]|uniref:VanZ family protein n=1 Tax=Denitromonas iodatirespirans TaxID=2795389 RepID=A0A944DEZ3_DENI1|nr:VanZ family protein [Denitromonas iodatirespirans]MBT0963178.1 VanZ family protein [Denitromonas iodatirespirans]